MIYFFAVGYENIFKLIKSPKCRLSGKNNFKTSLFSNAEFSYAIAIVTPWANFGSEKFNCTE